MVSQAAPGIGLSRVHYPVLTLGPGRRAGIWVQGCSIRCRGCIALDTWDPATADQVVLVSAIVDWVEGIEADQVDGITISGGEPFDQPASLEALLLALRRSPVLEHADLLAYSGYTLARIRREHPKILGLLDALISGPYVAALPTDRAWQGSSNQRLTLLTERAQERFGEQPELKPELQVATDGTNLWFVGIPRRGDMERMDSILQAHGIQIGRTSWRDE